MIITLLATNIEYDTDGPGIPTTHDLPASMEVQVDLDNINTYQPRIIQNEHITTKNDFSY
mgnify:CR=1 FL=1